MMKVLALVVILGLIVFGWSCLNYTVAFNLEHHNEFAERTGLPAPSPVIYWMGVLILDLASIFLGYLLGHQEQYKDNSGDSERM